MKTTVSVRLVSELITGAYERNEAIRQLLDEANQTLAATKGSAAGLVLTENWYARGKRLVLRFRVTRTRW